MPLLCCCVIFIPKCSLLYQLQQVHHSLLTKCYTHTVMGDNKKSDALFLDRQLDIWYVENFVS